MDDNFFDKKLKAALDRLEVPYDPTSWAGLEQRLNAPFAEEQPAPVDAVDKAVFRTLERLEAPYQPAHWDMLSSKMTQVARQRRRVWITKLSEAAIFLLLLANLDGFLGVETSNESLPAAPQAPKSNRLQAEAPASHGRRGNATFSGATNESVTSIVEKNLNGTTPYLAQYTDNQTFEETSTSNLSAQTIAGAAITVPDNNIGQWSLPANLMALPGLFLQPAERINVSPYATSGVNVKAPKQHRMYAATFASYDQNQVRSEGYSTSSAGYGGGMAIGYRIGKWGAEAGLSYNRRQYQPKKEIEIYDGSTVNGFYGSFAKNVDADIVAVPVKLIRRIAQFGQTTAHATAGVTTHIAVDKSYQYGSVYYPGQAPGGNLQPGQQPKLRQTGRGALESGSLRGNVYASADLGVRVEQPIGRHIVAFVEPSYRMALGKKGIGPNPAKINTLSVQAGVLATL